MRNLAMRIVCLAAVVASGIGMYGPQRCDAQTISADWQAGSGLYGEPSNWSAGVVPLNTGPVGFIVDIPDGAFSGSVPYSSTVTLGQLGSWSVNSLSLGAHRRLLVLGGVDLTTPDFTMAGTLECQGGSFTASSLASNVGTRATFCASQGGQIDLPFLDYTSTGLTANNNSGTSTTYVWPLLTASDPGTVIDLSSLVSFDAGYGPNTNDVNRHEVSSSNESIIDFSGVTTVTGPSGGNDWLRFTATGAGSQILFDSLEQTLGTSARGRIIFEADESEMHFPSLQSLESTQITLTGGAAITIGDPLEAVGGFATATNARFFASGGSTLEDDGTPATYTSTGLTANNNSGTSTTYVWPLLTASDPGTVIDLSSLVSFDAGYGPNTNDVNRHEVSSANSGVIDLSGVIQIVKPSGGNDWIRFTTDSGPSLIDLSSLLLIEGAGSGRAIFDVLEGAMILGSYSPSVRTDLNVGISGNLTVLGDIAPSFLTTINTSGAVSVGGSVVGGADFLRYQSPEGTLTIEGGCNPDIALRLRAQHAG